MSAPATTGRRLPWPGRLEFVLLLLVVRILGGRPDTSWGQIVEWGRDIVGNEAAMNADAEDG